MGRGTRGAGRLFSDSPVACDLTPCPYEVRIYPVGRCGVGMRVRGGRKRQEQARLLANSDALRGVVVTRGYCVCFCRNKPYTFVGTGVLDCPEKQPRLHRQAQNPPNPSRILPKAFSIPRRSLFVCIRTLLVQIPWSVPRVDVGARWLCGKRTVEDACPYSVCATSWSLRRGIMVRSGHERATTQGRPYRVNPWSLRRGIMVRGVREPWTVRSLAT